MLKEFNQYENLGTPGLFYDLFNQFRIAQQPWTRDSVSGYLYNKIIDGSAIFDGCLSLAESVEAIIIDEKGFITLNELLEATLINEKYLSNKLLEMIILSVREDEVFHDIFCSEHISYDIIYRLIQIENSAFKFSHASFKKLLLDFNFLYPHPDKSIRKLIVNSKYKKLFDSQILTEIKKRKIGIGELEKSLEQKQICGAEAELFVLAYEKKRLELHHKIGRVEIISEYDVCAGYDIVSYNNTDSIKIDRFIEVKSFSGVPNFFWSRNEVDVSRIMKEEYFLYLIDRSIMNNENYEPIIIQNPYQKVLQNDLSWRKSVEKYFITSNIII